jgi:hypothetical protein
MKVHHAVTAQEWPMPSIEELSNRLADADWSWWPLLALRPPKDQPIGHRLIAKLTLVGGPATAVLTAALIWLDGERNGLVLLGFSAPTIPAFYLVMRGVLARYWNRRATRLQREAAASLGSGA